MRDAIKDFSACKEPVMAERITTLLQDRLPLDPNRRLKVPAIRPEDDMVTVRRRL